MFNTDSLISGCCMAFRIEKLINEESMAFKKKQRMDIPLLEQYSEFVWKVDSGAERSQ